MNGVNQIISATTTQHVIATQTWAIGQDNYSLLERGIQYPADKSVIFKINDRAESMCGDVWYERFFYRLQIIKIEVKAGDFLNVIDTSSTEHTIFYNLH